MAPWDELCGSQVVKCLSAVWEAWVPSLGREDPLEEGRATHSSVLTWRIPWTEVGYSPWGRKESDTSEWLTLLFLEKKLNWKIWEENMHNSFKKFFC